MSPRDWRKNWSNYLCHWLGAGFGALLIAQGFAPLGIALTGVQYVYQLGSYWHKRDTLSRDLYDLTLGFFCGALLGIGLRLVS